MSYFLFTGEKNESSVLPSSTSSQPHSVAGMDTEDAERLLSTLREAALSHSPRTTLAEEQAVLRYAGELLIQHPGYASRVLIFALEKAAHEVHSQNDGPAGREGSRHE